MGLDTLELILAIEKEFCLDIPDAEAKLLTTPGLVVDHIVNKRNGSDTTGRTDGESAIWGRLQQLAAR